MNGTRIGCEFDVPNVSTSTTLRTALTVTLLLGTGTFIGGKRTRTFCVYLWVNKLHGICFPPENAVLDPSASIHMAVRRLMSDTSLGFHVVPGDSALKLSRFTLRLF